MSDDAENALRQEIQKVWDRTYLQGKSDGATDEQAAQAADAAREEFMEKWGIDPSMLAAPGPQIRHSGPKRNLTGSMSGFMGSGLAERDLADAPRLGDRPEPAAPPRPKSPVDLGSSPLRTSFGTGSPTSGGATRIGDLLKRAKELGAQRAAEKADPVAPASGSLQEMVERTRARERDAAAQGATPGGNAGAAPTRIEISNVREHRRAYEPPPESPPPSDNGAHADYEPAPPGTEDREARRREFLDEFDRIYEKVQSELEDRISILDMVDGSGRGGRAGPVQNPEEMERIARDLEHLMTELHQTMVSCEELSGRVAAFLDRHLKGAAAKES